MLTACYKHSYYHVHDLYWGYALYILSLSHTVYTYSQLQDKNHYVVVDMAYQGFATGNLDDDAAGLRQLVVDGHNVMLCQSFSKNMGLYGIYTLIHSVL